MGIEPSGGFAGGSPGVNRLKVAVIVKNRAAAFERDNRSMGMWSYAVPEFQWDFLYLGREFVAHTASYAKGYDFIFHEDGGNWGEFRGNALPILYHVIDSTLSEEHHYKPRYEQAKQANLILVDHDRLERFTGTGKKAVRFEYAVNDKVFKDYGLEKTTDVAFHCGGSDERQRVRVRLHEICAAHGWKYTSGVLPLVEYAQAMNRAKIVVNWPRAEGNRPHRVFDAMACKSYLLTHRLLWIDEGLTHNDPVFKENYWDYYDFEELEERLTILLGRFASRIESWSHDGWVQIQKHHTWAVRAQQLRELVKQEFGL